MNIIRLSSRVLTSGVIGALLVSFVLSFAFVGTAAAAPRTCGVFTATSSLYLRAVTGNQFGALDMVDVTLTKYTDGCGSEYGTVEEIDSGPYTSIYIAVSIGSAKYTFSSLPYPPGELVTPIIGGNSPVCGLIVFQAPPDPSGYGSGCTPS